MHGRSWRPETQGAAVALLEANGPLAGLGLSRSEVDRRIVDRGQAAERSRRGERKGQTASAAADFEQLFAWRDASVLDEERRQSTTLAPHQFFVLVRVARIEHCRHFVAPDLCRSNIKGKRGIG